LPVNFKDTSKLAIDLVDRWLDYQTYIRELPGISVGVAINGETLLRKSYGYRSLDPQVPATPETLYRIASHSKLFTACAIMKLFEAGKLRLDDTATQHLEWFRSGTDPNLEHVTLRQLLTHSSGMNRDGVTAHWINDEFPTLDDIKIQTAAGLSSFNTIEHWKYSNMAFTILGQVIEAVTSKSYEDAVRELVIEPMGLTNTMPDISEERLADHATGYGRKLPGQSREPLDHVRARVMNSATGFSSNVDDLLQFYRQHLYGNEDYLPDRLKREMQRVQFVDGDYTWGLGFSINNIDGTEIVGHSGGYPGFITVSFLCQKTKAVVVVLTNAIDGPAGDLGAGIMDIFGLAARHGELATGEIEADAAWLDDISGYYGDRWGVSLIQRVGNCMIGMPPGLVKPSLGATVAIHEDNKRRRRLRVATRRECA
jgi:CubicO group peptidase (beta-lactamase class C family)